MTNKEAIEELKKLKTTAFFKDDVSFDLAIKALENIDNVSMVTESELTHCHVVGNATTTIHNVCSILKSKGLFEEPKKVPAWIWEHKTDLVMQRTLKPLTIDQARNMLESPHLWTKDESTMIEME